MKIREPIFIIGAGRSGSSIFHRMFCTHKNVAWLTKWHARYSSNLEIIRYLTYLGDAPIIGSKLRELVKPSECYELWEQVCPGFSIPCRDLKAGDVTVNNKNNIQALFSKVVTERKNRLLIKVTGWPRIGFIREIFPDAKFIHIMRDGRAVTNSMLNVDFWWGWRGPQSWRWGELSAKDNDDWIKHNRSFVALAGIQWRILMDAMEEAKRHLDERSFMEVKYEDLCNDPINNFRKVIDFCGLEWSNDFDKNLNSFTLGSQDYKWKEQITEDQVYILDDVLKEYLNRFGYNLSEEEPECRL